MTTCATLLKKKKKKIVQTYYSIHKTMLLACYGCFQVNVFK